jgi:hypothetical protein
MPEVEELPVRVTLVVEQERGPELMAVRLAGAVALDVTATEAVAVQPVVGFLAVTV